MDSLSLPLAQWLESSGAKNDSVLLSPSDEIALIMPHLKNIKTIEIDVHNFVDGRYYSQVKHLRGYGKYREKIIAINAHIDQLQFMKRCGVDEFILSKEYNNIDIKPYTELYNICYQQAYNNSDMMQKF